MSSTYLLGIGMTAPASAGAIALGGSLMAKDTARTTRTGGRVIRTVHYGSTGPSKGTDSGSTGAGESGGGNGTGSTPTQTPQGDKK